MQSKWQLWKIKLFFLGINVLPFFIMLFHTNNIRIISMQTSVLSIKLRKYFTAFLFKHHNVFGVVDMSDEFWHEWSIFIHTVHELLLGLTMALTIISY